MNDFEKIESSYLKFPLLNNRGTGRLTKGFINRQLHNIVMRQTGDIAIIRDLF